MRYLLVLLLAALGCAAAPVTPTDTRPPVPLPNSAFQGYYPESFRQWTRQQWNAMPRSLRLTPPPTFRLVTGAEMKKIPGILSSESSGAYDPAGIVYTRYDIPSYHKRFLGHELFHRQYYIGYYPGKVEPMLMTWAQKLAWRAWVQSPTAAPNDGRRENYQLIPQYDLIHDRAWDHEKWAQAGLVTCFPGGVHPDYGRANPIAAAKVREFTGP